MARKPAIGCPRHGTDLRRIVISMDTETFDEVAAAAADNRCSFAAQARMLIEVGLETLKSDAVRPFNLPADKAAG